MPSSYTNGGPATFVKTMWSPPIVTLRCGLRARSSKLAGASAICSSAKSGSSRTTPSSSTDCPASRNRRWAPGWSKRTPTSLIRRRQPRSIVAIASSERIS